MRISPVPRRAPEQRNGFTFLEVLVALAAAALLLYVASATLVVSLKGEDLTREIERSRVLMNRLVFTAELGTSLDALRQEVRPDWEVQAAPAPASSVSAGSWEVWTVAPRNRPSLRSSIALPAP